MPYPATYRTGTVTVAAGGTSVTGIGTNFLAFGIRAGDILSLKGLTVSIASVESGTALTLADPWPGTAQTSQPYEIRYLGDPSRVLSATHAALAAIEAGGGGGGYSGPVAWADLTDVPTTFPPSTHTHPWWQVTGKPATYEPSAHRHNASEIDGITATAWADITGKPATYTPSAHGHVIGDVQDLTDALAAKSEIGHRHDASEIDNLPSGGGSTAWADLTGVPASFPPSAHTHATSEVTGLDAALGAKLDASLVSATALTLLDDTTTTAMRTTLGLGAAATWASVPNDHVTNARLANMAAGTIKGNAGASSADPADLTADQVKGMLGVVPVYATRAALAAAVPSLAQGTRARVGSVEYIIDSTATGMSSALWPEGVNGVRTETPANVFFGTFFKTDDVSTDFYTAQNPRILTQVNPGRISRGADQFLVGFDPSLWWDQDRKRFSQHVFQGGAPADVTEYRSKDLITWEAYYRNLGPTMIRSDTTPVSGGTVPASAVWWMGLHEEMAGANAGELYGVTIIRTFADFVDVNGRTIPNMQLYTSRVLDRDAMTFAAPVRMNFGNNTARVGFFPAWDGTKWVGFLKNDYNKNIECWHASTLTGAWTYQYTLNYTQDVEGCCVVPEYYYALGSSTLQRRWHLLTDAYWSGNYWLRSSTDLVNWTAETMIKSTTNIRHGNLYNFAYQPEAVQIIERAIAYYGAGNHGRPREWVELDAGANSIHPREDVTYYITGTRYATVDILFPAAKRPRFVVKSDSPVATIEILQGEFFAARNGVSEVIGGGISARSAIELDYDGSVYTVPALERRGDRAVALSSQTGFPSFTTSWKPQHRALYTTDGTSTYSAETVINNLPGDAGIDGIELCLLANTGVANGTIRIKANGSNISIGASDYVISTANGNNNRIHTMRRVGGLWRLMA